MGVTNETWAWFKKYLPEDRTTKICELGDQQFMACPPFPEFSWVGEYLKSIGYEVTSIDLNGLGGSLVIDLREEITDEKLLNTFDIITNFGTAEHVSDLYICMKNIHNMAKEGSLIFSLGPSPNNWPDHGFHYLDTSFYEGLASLCGYEIIELFKRKLNVGGVDSIQTHCLYRKLTDNEFCSEEEFNKLPVYTK